MDTNIESDRKLVERFKNGDEAAFVEIKRRYDAAIFESALALLRNRADAAEVAQDTFTRAHAGLKNFRGDSSLRTWLYRICRNTTCNLFWYFSRRRRDFTKSLDEKIDAESGVTLAELLPTDRPGPREELELAEFAADVESGMKQLAPNQREILILRNTLHCSYHDIANALGVNVGTVRSRIARARDCLRLKLDSDHAALVAAKRTN